jgi:hypothetical protein
MLGFLLTTLIFIGALVGFSKLADFDKIKQNWEKYRCRPDVMLMANYYGHDSTENMEFCLKNGFDERAKAAIGPFYTYLKGFVEILMTMLNSINSIRMIFATIVGSVTKVFSEFSARIQALFYRIQMTAIRLKFLMGRVFATMYAVVFMGMAGIKATQNFGNTFLFKFLDTFCFDPDTQVEIKGKGKIPISHVRIGDEFMGGERVTSTFQFNADGQPMVSLPRDKLTGNDGIIVSTNHYVLYNNRWIKAVDHPDARPVADWAGGVNRPLICFNTNTNSFPIGQYTFRDYDETEAGDEEAMEMAMKMLNGKRERERKGGDKPVSTSSIMACSADTMICLKHSVFPVPASSINLGTQLTNGEVVGIVKKVCSEVCYFYGERFAPATAVWCNDTNKWRRVSEFNPIVKLQESEIFYSFVVTPSACIQTEKGTIFRDYVEVHSPDLELPYAASIETLSI